MTNETKLPFHLENHPSIVFYKETKAQMLECSDEEKLIYGVKFKKDPNYSQTILYVTEIKFRDSTNIYFGVFFESLMGGRSHGAISLGFFEKKEKAIDKVNNFLKEIKWF